MKIRKAIRNINLTHCELYFNAVMRDGRNLPIPKNFSGESLSIKYKKKAERERERERERDREEKRAIRVEAGRLFFVRELFKGLSHWLGLERSEAIIG